VEEPVLGVVLAALEGGGRDGTGVSGCALAIGADGGADGPALQAESTSANAHPVRDLMRARGQ